MVTFNACLRAFWRPLLPFALLFLPQLSFGAELRLYVMPTFPVRMNWNSPRDLLISSLNAVPLNRFHTIGHISLEVNCSGGSADLAVLKQGDKNYLLTGAVPEQKTFTADLLLRDKVGFSILEVGWPGKIETASDVLRALKGRNHNPQRLSVITYQISDKTCQRLLQYYREYSAAAPTIFYGNSPRPRSKEGSGCSAFGASFLEVAGLMTENLRQEWTTRRRVPLSLMAGYQGRKSITIWEILKSPDSREWARESDPHMDLETYDPDRISDWVRRLVEWPEDLHAMGGEVDPSLPHGLQGIAAIKFDYRDLSTPTEPLFKSSPRLERVGPKTVVRKDKVVSENGSFELRP